MVIMAFSILHTLVLSIYIDGLEGFPYYVYFPLHERFFIFYKASLFVSAFPVSTIYYLLVRKKKENEAQEIHIQTEAHAMPANGSTEEDNAQAIELSGKTKDCIRLLPKDILFVKALGNYVAVYYLKNGEEDHKLLRISLSDLSDSLCDYPYIVRCHRAFMVNIQKMEKIHGNLKGYRLELKNTDTKVPVSKSYTRIVKDKIMHADR